MIRTIVLYGLERGIEHCYLLVTDAFARLPRRLGLVLHQAGIAIDHRGWRTPYRMGVRESVASLCNRTPAVRELFARKALAYQPFSMPDDDIDQIVQPMRPFPPPLTANARPLGNFTLPRIWNSLSENVIFFSQ